MARAAQGQGGSHPFRGNGERVRRWRVSVLGEESDMDGIELGRQVARMRAESTARTRLAIRGRSRSPDAAATDAERVASALEPLRRFDALRRRTGADPLARADRSRCNRARGAAT